MQYGYFTLDFMKTPHTNGQLTKLCYVLLPFLRTDGKVSLFRHRSDD